jgi:hypothetical protein
METVNVAVLLKTLVFTTSHKIARLLPINSHDIKKYQQKLMFVQQTRISGMN